MTIRNAALAGISTVLLTLTAGGALAGAFGIREQSTLAEGQAFAGAASGSGGVSSMFWNPATITMNPGWVSEQNLSFINLSSKITPTGRHLAVIRAIGRQRRYRPGSRDPGRRHLLSADRQALDRYPVRRSVRPRDQAPR